MFGRSRNPIKRAIRRYMWQWFKRRFRAAFKRNRSRKKRGKYGLLRGIFRACACSVALGGMMTSQATTSLDACRPAHSWKNIACTADYDTGEDSRSRWLGDQTRSHSPRDSGHSGNLASWED